MYFCRMKFLLILSIAITPTLLRAQNTNCGTERWNVKTLHDKDTTLVNLTPVSTTLHDQISLETLTPGQSDVRLPVERQAYVLNATLAWYKLEEDGDIHMVLTDGVDSLVAEIPNPDCPTLQGTSHVEQYQINRMWLNAFVGK